MTGKADNTSKHHYCIAYCALETRRIGGGEGTHNTPHHHTTPTLTHTQTHTDTPPLTLATQHTQQQQRKKNTHISNSHSTPSQLQLSQTIPSFLILFLQSLLCATAARPYLCITSPSAPSTSPPSQHHHLTTTSQNSCVDPSCPLPSPLNHHHQQQKSA